MKSIRIITLLTIVFIALAGCNNVGNSSEIHDNLGNITIQASSPKLVKLSTTNTAPDLADMSKTLGAVFYSNGDAGGVADTDVTSCLNLEHFDFDIATDGDAVRTVTHVEYAQDTANRISQLTAQAGLNASYSLFGAYANIATDETDEINSNEMQFSYYSDSSFPVGLYLKNNYDSRRMADILNASALALYDTSQPEFSNRCGNYYVNKFELASKLRYTLKVKFNNVKQKQLFALDGGVNSGDLGALAVKLAQFNLNNHANLIISLTIDVRDINKEKPMPDAPSSCFNIDSIGKCVQDIVTSANSYTRGVVTMRNDRMQWLLNNPDASYTDKLTAFSGMQGLAPTDDCTTYTSPYPNNDDVDIKVDKKLQAMQQTIYTAIKNIGPHLMLVENVVPLLQYYGLGDNDDTLKQTLNNLISRKNYN